MAWQLNQIDRSITPELLEIGSFSYFFLDEDINEKIFIKDNIDRFFYADAQIWLYEQYAINTQNVLTPTFPRIENINLFNWDVFQTLAAVHYATSQ